VPRAKRTARAEARRRHRAAANIPDSDLDELDELDSDPGASAAPSAPKRASAPAAQATVPPRPGIAAAFRGAFRPIDLRGDLRALPRLLLTLAFLIPAGSIVAIAVVVAVTGGKELISQLIAPYFLYPPPIAPVFIAGFLATRASWLLGGIIGIVQSLALVILSAPGFGLAPTAPADTSVVAYSMVVSVGFGAFYAAAAAWYKRFLRGANPPRRAAAGSSKGSGKPKSGGSSRPLLARKR
jgi:hypothetical protein